MITCSRLLVVMLDADSEIQENEVDALSSILDEATFEINKKSIETEQTYGTLVVEVTLPDEFYIEYHSSITLKIFYYYTFSFS